MTVTHFIFQQPSISKNENDHGVREHAPSMTPYIRKLELVKEVARCNEHQGNNTWCWVDQNNRNHIPLCLNDLQIWAKFLVHLVMFLLILIHLMGHGFEA
jgi:hypothetical protein